MQNALTLLYNKLIFVLVRISVFPKNYGIIPLSDWKLYTQTIHGPHVTSCDHYAAGWKQCAFNQSVKRRNKF